MSGPVAVAAVRAALLLERPSTAVQMAVATSAAADIAREHPDNAGLVYHQRRTMVLSIVVAVLNMAVVLVDGAVDKAATARLRARRPETKAFHRHAYVDSLG